jgi:predicted PurR-regulated permease PerM
MKSHAEQEANTQRLMLFIVLGGLVFAGYIVLELFIVPLAWGAILVYGTWPLYQRLCRLLRGSTMVGASLMTLVLTAAFVLPAFWLASVLADEVKTAYQHVAERLAQGPLTVPAFLTGLPWLGDWLKDFLQRTAGDPALLRAEVGQWVGRFSGELARFAGGLGRNLLQLSMALLAAFFFYRYGEAFIDQFRRVVQRFVGRQVVGYVDAAGATVKAVIYGLLLTALAQGMLAGIGYWVAGIDAPILFGLLTALVALLPFGTPFVWGSIGIWLIFSGQLWAGIGLLVWGMLVVSSIDNILRPMVISTATNVPFLLVLMGVLGGVAAFGLVGLVVGPVILAVLTAVWREWVAETVD